MGLRFISVNLSAQSQPEESLSSIQEWTDETGRIVAQGYSYEGYYWLRWPDYATFRFDDSDDVFVFHDVSVSPEIITDLYYRSVYPLILQSRGVEVLHASAVVTKSGIIAFAANSGSGKSTLAYSLSRRGYQLWADDAVAIEFLGNRLLAVKIPFSNRLLPDAAAYFQQFNNPSDAPDSIGYPDQEEDGSLPVLAICLLHRHDMMEIEIIQMKPADAFTSLLSQAYYYQIPDITHKQSMMKHYLDIADRIPIYQIHFPVGFQYLDAVLNQLDQLVKKLIK